MNRCTAQVAHCCKCVLPVLSGFRSAKGQPATGAPPCMAADEVEQALSKNNRLISHGLVTAWWCDTASKRAEMWLFRCPGKAAPMKRRRAWGRLLPQPAELPHIAC